MLQNNPARKNMTWRFIDTDKIDGYYSTALFESIAKHVGSDKVDNTILFWRVQTSANGSQARKILHIPQRLYS